MKSELLFSKILSYCSSPKLESPLTSVDLGQSLVSQSLKVTLNCLESSSKEISNRPAAVWLLELKPAVANLSSIDEVLPNKTKK